MKNLILLKMLLKKNGFENSALIYSISETSTSGGNIGWISENSINKKILKKITEININEHYKPFSNTWWLFNS